MKDGKLLDYAKLIEIKEEIIMSIRSGMDMEHALKLKTYLALSEEEQSYIFNRIKIIQSL